jgi:hypothetical protein
MELKDVNLVELEIQDTQRRNFYKNPRSSLITLEDEICEVLMVDSALEDFITDLLGLRDASIPHPALGKQWQMLRDFLAGKTSGRIDSNCTPNTLDKKLNDLLKSTNPPEQLSEWRNSDGYTEKYFKYRDRYYRRDLIALLHEIWRILVQRRGELGQLHGSSSFRDMNLNFRKTDVSIGTAESGKILGKVKRRTQTISPLIDKYNNILSQLKSISTDLSLSCLEPLDKKKLMALDLDDPFWELGLLECQEKWAVDVSIQKHLRAFNEYKRAMEEVKILVMKVQ